MGFYNGERLLSLKDLDGETPEIFLCVGNRSAGKTTFFNSLLFHRFLKNGEKFILLYRYQNELNSVAEKFFKDIQQIFFPSWRVTAKPLVSQKIVGLFARDESKDWENEKTGWENCGYAISLRSAPKIKPYSHLLSDGSAILFDEFQPEDNSYLPKEIDYFISLHTTCARGRGKQNRYLPVYMVSNAITILNPYYSAMGISARLTPNTKTLRGHGWVMEAAFNKSASNASKNSAFNRAFLESGSNYIKSSNSQSVYLQDDQAFIETPKGSSKYIATIIYEGSSYGIREFPQLGLLYIDDHPDSTSPLKIALTINDHAPNYILLENSSVFIYRMRRYFELGCFRFKNLKSRSALLKLISY